MKRNTPWVEKEIQAAVAAYFDLLNSHQKLEPTNKSAIYQKLSSNHPARSAKAFELKFQNISAVLYEEENWGQNTDSANIRLSSAGLI